MALFMQQVNDKKVWKQDGDGMEFKGCNRTKVNCKAFAILALTASYQTL